MPAHITVLFPFVPVDELDDQVSEELRELFAREPSFDFELPRVERFPEVVWLAPEPPEPFNRLTQLVFERFPDYPPYEGVHETVIPHLTVAEGDAAVQEAVEAALTPHLPIRGRAERITLLVEDERCVWHATGRFALA